MKKTILIIGAIIVAGFLLYGVKSNAPTVSVLEQEVVEQNVVIQDNGEEDVLGNESLDEIDVNNEEESLGNNEPEEDYIDPGFEGIPGDFLGGGSEEDVDQQDEIKFTGTLEEVNTACFADGECYVVVDGKKVTLIIGWSRDIVGEVRSTDGIGGLQENIGQEIEVYAATTEDGNYTLYGKEEYYVELVAPELAE